ncbi:hypothetical protein U9M48_012912 [Paspalum notatum var. saurae]|uniref:Uncharacterized protein n=1 Tax=Paspalum notatum var. saurae TaxID=547442 RepID=A0AAQ3SYI8_PASNO
MYRLRSIALRRSFREFAAWLRASVRTRTTRYSPPSRVPSPRSPPPCVPGPPPLSVGTFLTLTVFSSLLRFDPHLPPPLSHPSLPPRPRPRLAVSRLRSRPWRCFASPSPWCTPSSALPRRCPRAALPTLAPLHDAISRRICEEEAGNGGICKEWHQRRRRLLRPAVGASEVEARPRLAVPRGRRCGPERLSHVAVDAAPCGPEPLSEPVPRSSTSARVPHPHWSRRLTPATSISSHCHGTSTTVMKSRVRFGTMDLEFSNGSADNEDTKRRPHLILHLEDDLRMESLKDDLRMESLVKNFSTLWSVVSRVSGDVEVSCTEHLHSQQ